MMGSGNSHYPPFVGQSSFTVLLTFSKLGECDSRWTWTVNVQVSYRFLQVCLKQRSSTHPKCFDPILPSPLSSDTPTCPWQLCQRCDVGWRSGSLVILKYRKVLYKYRTFTICFYRCRQRPNKTLWHWRNRENRILRNITAWRGKTVWARWKLQPQSYRTSYMIPHHMRSSTFYFICLSLVQFCADLAPLLLSRWGQGCQPGRDVCYIDPLKSKGRNPPASD